MLPGLIVRDESVAELTELLASYAELGFGHAIVILEPRTAGAIERLAKRYGSAANDLKQVGVARMENFSPFCHP